ncbi:uncharacterized protein LOC113871387 [Abrus precatorius]|uniref:Uncharacterized protein LOC113871387 n=1 Tax=Abrus precatorius TaxID=3816 RepID=A0A8B8M6I2_ABRPR|nr:uncharacterized protein LOC113871387 [Abrus precatorius]
MSRRVILQTTSSQKRQPFLQQSKSIPTTRLGEAVGGTAAVCCCCPCGLATVMYLAICKLPASLCVKLLKRKRRRHLKDGLFPPRRRCSCGFCDDMGVRIYPICSDDDEDVAVLKSRSSVVKEDKEVMELEKEMWDRFYGSGFWRSPSQRDNNSSNNSSLLSQRIGGSVSFPNLQVLSA